MSTYTNTSPTNIYTLSLHDALPISNEPSKHSAAPVIRNKTRCGHFADVADVFLREVVDQKDIGNISEVAAAGFVSYRSEEHTSELQSRLHLVCRLLLEKKNGNSSS